LISNYGRKCPLLQDHHFKIAERNLFKVIRRGLKSSLLKDHLSEPPIAYFNYSPKKWKQNVSRIAIHYQNRFNLRCASNPPNNIISRNSSPNTGFVYFMLQNHPRISPPNTGLSHLVFQNQGERKYSVLRITIQNHDRFILRYFLIPKYNRTKGELLPIPELNYPTEEVFSPASGERQFFKHPSPGSGEELPSVDKISPNGGQDIENAKKN
jgi:hypothetical protein